MKTLIALLFVLFATTGHLLAAGPEIELVQVKGGCFKMGDTFGDGVWQEKPEHEVCVNDFFIGKYVVTQAQYKKITGKNPSEFPNCGPDCPVENVSKKDADTFINKLNRISGKKYRLPTEAEWEYTARSGGQNEKWAGTSSPDDLGAYAWFTDNSELKIHPVGSRRPNGLGIYDMSGNVWQWCSDWYNDNYYSKSPKDNPKGIKSGFMHVVRGGSWNSASGDIRVSNREAYVPGYKDRATGFRLVLDSK
jgi:formylglycine-generating enzyme required for sulfatase activity